MATRTISMAGKTIKVDERLRTSANSRSWVGVAALLVSCLVEQDIIRIDLDDHHSFDNMNNAIQIVAACLQKISPTADKLADLPFNWGPIETWCSDESESQ